MTAFGRCGERWYRRNLVGLLREWAREPAFRLLLGPSQPVLVTEFLPYERWPAVFEAYGVQVAAARRETFDTLRLELRSERSKEKDR